MYFEGFSANWSIFIDSGVDIIRVLSERIAVSYTSGKQQAYDTVSSRHWEQQRSSILTLRVSGQYGWPRANTLVSTLEPALVTTDVAEVSLHLTL